MRIAVVIPSLNSPIIDQVVNEVLRQAASGHEIEVLVVGRDEAHVVPHVPSVKFIDTGKPISPARARNMGVAQAKGDIICFLDADCIPIPGWLEQLVAAYEAGHPVVGGGVALEHTSYWALCDDLLSFGSVLTTTRPGARKTLPSLNLCLARETFEQSGGFSEVFSGPAGEDADLCLRLREAGYPLHCEPPAAVYHRHKRRSFRHTLSHLYHYGSAHAKLHERYPALSLKGFGSRHAKRWPLLLCPAAPLLATVDVLMSFLRGRYPWQFSYAAPGMILAKSAWYFGLALAPIGHHRNRAV